VGSHTIRTLHQSSECGFTHSKYIVPVINIQMTGTMYLECVNPHSDDWYNVLIMFIDNIQMTDTMYL
jgi:hypothetical protein